MLDVFIEGELINLAIPTEEFAAGDVWYRWLNEPAINRYLEQGAFPNTKKSQVQFFNSIGKDRLVFVIENKSHLPLGVISLSFIDHVKKACDFALFVDPYADLKASGLGSLEAVSLIITHGFNQLGLKRISAGQHVNLYPWQNRLELLGFRLEGLHRRKFVKGNEFADSVSISCLYTDFLEISSARNGRLWDGSRNMSKRIKSLPSETFRSKLDLFFKEIGDDYYRNIWSL
jgi:RimJ/RimL family protein N-acetyltransferase